MPDQQKIDELKVEIQKLKQELNLKEQHLNTLINEQQNRSSNPYCGELSTSDVVRYSRQMIMPNVNVKGQLALKNSKILIVGTGGLGCPSALYLASAGVGEITLIDHDEVELTNLHRQVLHTENDIGTPKVKSAFNKLNSINSNIKLIPLQLHANSKTLEEVIQEKKFDVVIDGSDNVATRYLLNDICVINKIPLVSGSALQMEGQLTVYNYKGGPCYRCLFPVPPPAHTVTSCGDGGVLGPIPGTIGVLQALETIKILINADGVLSGRLLLFDGTNTTFRNVKLRGRNPACDVCGDSPSITKLIDYEQFCGASAHDKVVNIDILNSSEKINVKEIPLSEDNIILDVRPELEYNMCKLPNTVNVPYNDIAKGTCIENLKHIFENKVTDGVKDLKVYVLCRRGNDSQRSIAILKKAYSGLPITFFNVTGGLHLYGKQVDSRFPIY